MAPSASPRRRFSSPEMTCTGMWRVAGSCFRRSRIVQPAMSGRLMSSVMAPGLNSRASGQRGGAAQRHQGLDAAIVRQVHQDARERDVVLDDQQHRIAGLDQVAVVVDFEVVHHHGRRGRRRRQDHVHAVVAGHVDAVVGDRRRSAKLRRPERPAALRSCGRYLGDVGLRQIQRERAAHAGRALQADFAAQQARQFAADGKAQAGAAVLAAGGAVGLLEGFEDDPLLVLRNADAGIGDRERDHRFHAIEHRSGSRSSPRWRVRCAAARIRAR